MKKISVILLASLISFLLIKQKVQAQQRFFIFDNQVNFQDWPTNELTKLDYQVFISRNGQKYQTQLEFKQSATSDRWQKTDRVSVFPEGINYGAYFLLTNDENEETIISRQLLDEEIDFTNLNFDYKMVDYNPEINNHPVAIIELCGQKDYLVLEHKEVAARGYFAQSFWNDNQMWLEIMLPNPETCQENREFKIRMLKKEAAEQPTLIKIGNFNFNNYYFLTDDLVQIKAEEEIALIVDNAIVNQGKEFLIDNLDLKRNIIELGLIENQDVIGTKIIDVPQMLSEEINAETKINKIESETDKSLTISIDYQSFMRLKEIEVRISDSLQAFQDDWYRLEMLSQNQVINYGGINYVDFNSHYENTKIINAVIEDKKIQEDGFYLAARAKDHFGRLGKISQVYFCQKQICQELKNQNEKKVTVQKIFFNDEQQTTEIEIANLTPEEIDLKDWTITGKIETGIKLQEKIMAWEKIKIKIDDPMIIDRNGVEIKLYDQNSQLQETNIYKAIEEPLIWKKNLSSQEWKKIYVNN